MHLTRLQLVYNRFRRQVLSHVLLARVLLLAVIILVLSGAWLVLRRPLTSLVANWGLISGQALPQTAGRTNLVILGTGGDGHQAPDLADSVMFVSIKLDTGAATLISIPRDLWVPSLRAKINTAYHYGLVKQATPGGLLLAKSAVSESLNQPVHFAVVINFSTFARAIDILGGIDITVDRTFDDDQYPIPGKENDLCDGDPEYKCRYEHLRFEAGPQHMDGERALKFVRSRHSTDPEEGTDFARSKRQEKVIAVVRSKLTSLRNLKNTQIYKDLYDLAVKSVVTDITPQYYATFVKLGLKMRKTPFQTFSIEDYLENPPLSLKYDNQWVLVPKGGDSSALFSFISSLLP